LSAVADDSTRFLEFNMTNEETKPLFVSMNEAARLCSLSKSTLVRLEVSDPTFPRICRISDRKSIINLAALEGWIAVNSGVRRGSVRGAAEAAQKEVAA